MDAFLNRLVSGTEALLGLLSRLTRRPEGPRRNRWFDFLQAVVITALLALVAGLFLVEAVDLPGSSRWYVWRLGSLVTPVRGTPAFVGKEPVVVAGQAGDLVLWRQGAPVVVPAGWDQALTNEEKPSPAYALLPGATRAQILPTLGLTATTQDRKDAAELAGRGWSDAAEWERFSAGLLARYQPDNATARQVAQKRENGQFVPQGWVCVVVRGQPELVREDQLRGILLEVSHGR